MLAAVHQSFERALASNEILAVVVTFVLTFVAWVASQLYKGRPQIAWAFSHQHAFLLKEKSQPTLVYTKEIWILNRGRAIGEQVEINFPVKPQHFDIWPQRQYAEIVNPDGSITIKFENINSGEQITISLFQVNVEPTRTIYVRWRGGIGKNIPMAPQEFRPRWVMPAARIVVFFCAFSAVYFLIRIL